MIEEGKHYPIYTYVGKETPLFHYENMQIFIIPYKSRFKVVVNALSPLGMWIEIMNIKPVNNSYTLSWYLRGQLMVKELDDNWSLMRTMLPENKIDLIKQQVEAYAVANRLTQAK